MASLILNTTDAPALLQSMDVIRDLGDGVGLDADCLCTSQLLPTWRGCRVVGDAGAMLYTLTSVINKGVRGATVRF